jgi:hypothetical protein
LGHLVEKVQVLAHCRILSKQNVLLHLELVAKDGVDGLAADLEDLVDDEAHLVALRQRRQVRVGGHRDPRIVDLIVTGRHAALKEKRTISRSIKETHFPRSDPKFVDHSKSDCFSKDFISTHLV